MAYVNHVRVIQCPAGDVCSLGTRGPCSTNSDCNPGQTCSNGKCGRCTVNSECASGQACVDGVCGSCASSSECDSGLVCINDSCQECPPGQTACGKFAEGGPSCVNTQTDSKNCGACGNPCSSTQTCESSMCTDCPSVQRNCDGTCRDTNSDNNNCGVCGVECPTVLGQICQNGSCQCSTGKQPDTITGQSVCSPGLYRNPQGQCVAKCRDDNAVYNNIGSGSWACGPNGYFPDREVCCRTDISPPAGFACI
jgi:hypothetical protein